MPEQIQKSQVGGEKSDEELKAAIAQLLKDHPRGFSISPDGALTSDRESIEITNADQLAQIVREPKTVRIDLSGGKVISLRIRPLSADEWREIENMDAEAPLPPFLKATSPSLAKNARPGQQQDQGYDWNDADYRKKNAAFRVLKRAAIVCKGLISIEVPGDTLEKRSAYLSEKFTPQILDTIEGAIRLTTSEPIERAVFTSSAG